MKTSIHRVDSVQQDQPEQGQCYFSANGFTEMWDTFTLEVPVVIRLTCDCAVADDAVMPIRAESSS